MLTSLLFKQCLLLQVATLVFCTEILRGEILDVENCKILFFNEIEIPKNKVINCNQDDFLERHTAEEYRDEKEINYPYTCIATHRNKVILDFYNDTVGISKDGDFSSGTFLNLNLSVPVGTQLILFAIVYQPIGESCVYMNSKIIEEKCDEKDSLAEVNENSTKISPFCTATFDLSCQLPGFAKCYNVKWFQNSTLLDESDSSTENNTISIQTVRFDDVTHTDFHCRVFRHEKVVLERHYDVCFKGHKNDDKIGLKESSPVVEAQLGSSVTLLCNGNGGESRIYWRKTIKKSPDDILCSLILGVQQNYQSTKGKYDCSMSFTADESYSKCQTPESCRNKFTVRFNTTLHINNVGKDDLGNYTCVTTGGTEFGSMSLEEMPSRPPVTFAATTLAFLAGVLILLLTAGIVIHLYKTELKLFWKRHLADVEPEDRTFAVFLSYCYNSESQEGTNQLLHKLHDWFERKNYHVFDQYRNHSGELRHELIRRMVPNCHRMVIVLTRDYMMNEDAMSNVNTGIQCSIGGDTRLIFIVTPLFQDYFQRQLKAGDASCRAIKMSMGQKRNSVIYWKEKEQGKCFKALDVVMPKLGKRSSSERIPLESDRLV